MNKGMIEVMLPQSPSAEKVNSALEVQTINENVLMKNSSTQVDQKNLISEAMKETVKPKPAPAQMLKKKEKM